MDERERDRRDGYHLKDTGVTQDVLSNYMQPSPPASPPAVHVRNEAMGLPPNLYGGNIGDVEKPLPKSPGGRGGDSAFLRSLRRKEYGR